MSYSDMVDLVHAEVDHDEVSRQVRSFAAQRLYELIETNRRHVEVAFSDPAGLWDVEPARIQAHVSLVKLQAVLIKELGSLYQLSRAPVRPGDEVAVMPVSEVEELLLVAAREREEAVAVAVAAAVAAVRVEVEVGRRLELEAARGKVLDALSVLKQT